MMARFDSVRAQVASETHSKYPPWTDAQGRRRPFSRHPNYDVTRHLADSLLKQVAGRAPADRLCPDWRASHFTMVRELTEQIGFRPSPHHNVDTVEEHTDVFGPDSVIWVRWVRAGKKAQAAYEAAWQPGDGVSLRDAPADLRGVPEYQDRVRASRTLLAAGQRGQALGEVLYSLGCAECDSLLRSGRLPVCGRCRLRLLSAAAEVSPAHSKAAPAKSGYSFEDLLD